MKAILIGGSWHGKTLDSAPTALRIHLPVASSAGLNAYGPVFTSFELEPYLRGREPVLDYYIYAFEADEPEAESKPSVVTELLTELRANPGALDKEIARAVRRIEASRFR